MTQSIYENFQTYTLLRGTEYSFVRDQDNSDAVYPSGK